MDKFKNGFVSCTNGYNYRSTCTFKCHPGYNLISSNIKNDRPFMTYECKETSVWDKGIEPPACEKITCQRIKSVS